MNKPIHKALFSCSNDYCRQECSYPADMIYWYEPEKRWVCEMCWSDLPEESEKGISLKDFFITINLKVSDLL